MSWPAGVRATQLGHTLDEKCMRIVLLVNSFDHLGGPHLRAMTVVMVGG